MLNRTSFIGVSCVVVVCIVIGIQILKINDGKIHVVVCNVGQGDAILIRTPEGFDILFDGGPDQKVLDCLSSYMPFWDRELDMVIISHPHSDHFMGIFYVIDRYTIKHFVTEQLRNDSAEFSELMRRVEENKIKTQHVYQNDSFKTPDGLTVQILGPSKEFLRATSPNGVISESGEFASLIIHLSYGSFDMLLTGDAQANQLAHDSSNLKNIEVLQVPHHGSKTGLTDELVKTLNPDLAVISVGKNSYGHPAGNILQILDKFKVPILQTNKKGTIEIATDGVGSMIIAEKSSF